MSPFVQGFENLPTLTRSSNNAGFGFPLKGPLLSYLLQSVVRRFLGDNHIVDVAFAQAGGAHPEELGFLVEFRDGRAAAVAHTGAQAAD